MQPQHKQPWRSHYNAICGDWVAKHNRTTRNGVGNCSSKTGSRRQSEKKTILKHFLKGFLEGKSLAPKTHFVRDFLQNSIANSSTSTTCNPIYIAGTILQLQITMEFCRPHMHETQVTPHLQCGTDPTMVREWSDHGPRMIRPHTRPSRTRRTAEVDHRRSGTHFVWKNIGFRASAISQKRISCETSSKTPSATPPPAPHAIPFTLRERSYSCKSQWNSIGNSSTGTTCNPICIAGTTLQLQITMEFCRPQMHETQVTPHLQCGTDPTMVRDRSDHDPTTHETVSQPSHRRGRSSRFGDGLCMEKHRVSCICYLSKTHFVRRLPSKLHRQLLHQHHLQSHLQWGNDPRVANHNGIPSATHPPAPLAIPFTLRERSYSCKSQWNSVDRTCTKHRWHPIYNAEPIRPWSENDPTMIRPHTRPSRNRRTRRGRSSRFGDALCMEKHRVSCICYLSKTHFVRDFLQNSIGNSSTSTTCNPIYSEGTISLLTLSVTNSFPH